MIKVGDIGMDNVSVKNLEKFEKEFHDEERNIRETQDFEKPEKLYEDLMRSKEASPHMEAGKTGFGIVLCG